MMLHAPAVFALNDEVLISSAGLQLQIVIRTSWLQNGSRLLRFLSVLALLLTSLSLLSP